MHRRLLAKGRKPVHNPKTGKAKDANISTKQTTSETEINTQRASKKKGHREAFQLMRSCEQ